MAGEKSWYEYIRGKRTKDINLPNESGEKDTTLNDPERLLKGLENNASLKALRAYGESTQPSGGKKP